MAWTHFMLYLRRALPGVDVQYFKTWEPQQRLAQHAHVMFRFSGPVTDRRARAAIRLFAARWGFGNPDVKPIDTTSERAVARTAGYCAKYASKTSEQSQRVLVDHSTGEVFHLHLRAWSASAEWGDRMKELKDFQRAWAASAAARKAQPTGAVLLPGGEAALDLNCDFYTLPDSGSLVELSLGSPAPM
jgi:hypothetical protein